jgi:hypothetical protein
MGADRVSAPHPLLSLGGLVMVAKSFPRTDRPVPACWRPSRLEVRLQVAPLNSHRVQDAGVRQSPAVHQLVHRRREHLQFRRDLLHGEVFVFQTGDASDGGTFSGDLGSICRATKALKHR